MHCLTLGGGGHQISVVEFQQGFCGPDAAMCIFLSISFLVSYSYLKVMFFSTRGTEQQSEWSMWFVLRMSVFRERLVEYTQTPIAVRVSLLSGTNKNYCLPFSCLGILPVIDDHCISMNAWRVFMHYWPHPKSDL